MNIERKLASVQKITSVIAHPNADKMEIAQILGWHVCVKKGEFKAGDLCVYCETDSVLPPKSEFEFLKNKDYRIKAIRLRGIISQGIAFPMSILDSSWAGYQVEGMTAFVTRLKSECLIEGKDVTAFLQVTKYEPPAPKCQNAKGGFPTFIVKTDQVRIQAAPTAIQRNIGKTFIMSEKLDGSSMTVYLKDGQFGVCSRNLELKDEGSNPWWDAAKKYNIEERMRQIGGNIAIQGEVLYAGNWYYPNDLVFRVFDIYDIGKNEYYNHEELVTRAQSYGLETVPQIGEYTFTAETTVDQLVEMVTRKSSIQPGHWQEGFVFSSKKEERDPELGRLSFKVINPEYQLAHD